MGKYKILDIKFLTKNTYRLRSEWCNLPVRAGQCFNVGMADSGVNREYSIYSDANAPHLDFLIRDVLGGIVSSSLKELKPGSFVEIDGPYGDFCLREPISLKQHYLFLATGTGIAPFHSFVKTYPQLNYTILHGIRTPEEQYDSTDYATDRYLPCISGNTNGRKSMRITQYLREHPTAPDSLVYLCGNRNMIVEAYEILREQGVLGDNIFTEVFF